MFANVFIIFGITYLWYFSIRHLVQDGAGPDIALFNRDDFALFIGTAVFSFEGIGLSMCTVFINAGLAVLLYSTR